MFPLGLRSPRFINLCMMSSCGFLWWSPFAELETSLIKPTSLTHPSLNYKSIQRCSFFSPCNETLLWLYFSHRPHFIFSFPLWETHSKTCSSQWVGIVWTSHQDCAPVAPWRWIRDVLLLTAMIYPYPPFSCLNIIHLILSLWWKLRLWVHALIPSWCPEPLLPSLLTLSHLISPSSYDRIFFLPPICI